MRYAVIKHFLLTDTVAHVNAALRDGWHPLGGVAYADGGYAQAVVHRTRTDLPLPETVREYKPHEAKR